MGMTPSFLIPSTWRQSKRYEVLRSPRPHPNIPLESRPVASFPVKSAPPNFLCSSSNNSFPKNSTARSVPLGSRPDFCGLDVTGPRRPTRKPRGSHSFSISTELLKHKFNLGSVAAHLSPSQSRPSPPSADIRPSHNSSVQTNFAPPTCSIINPDHAEGEGTTSGMQNSGLNCWNFGKLLDIHSSQDDALVAGILNDIAAREGLGKDTRIDQ